MSKIKNGGLDQYDAEPFEQQQFGTAGVEGVNTFGNYLNKTEMEDKRFNCSRETARRSILSRNIVLRIGVGRK